MSDVKTTTGPVDPRADNARKSMQDAFRSDVEKDLTRGSFEPTAQFSKVEHVRTIEEEEAFVKQDAALLARLLDSDEAKIAAFVNRLTTSCDLIS